MMTALCDPCKVDTCRRFYEMVAMAGLVLLIISE